MIQSILFDRDYWTLDEAINEFHFLNFTLPKNKMPHTTQRYIRLRVKNPNYKKYTYRIIWFSKKDHIKAIYGFPK